MALLQLSLIPGVREWGQVTMKVEFHWLHLKPSKKLSKQAIRSRRHTCAPQLWFRRRVFSTWEPKLREIIRRRSGNRVCLRWRRLGKQKLSWLSLHICVYFLEWIGEWLDGLQGRNHAMLFQLKWPFVWYKMCCKEMWPLLNADGQQAKTWPQPQPKAPQ